VAGEGHAQILSKLTTENMEICMEIIELIKRSFLIMLGVLDQLKQKIAGAE
jgi:hypothetical protein